MKKLIRLISAAIISVAFMGGVANAATCDGFITVTGPSSNNQVSCNDINDLVVNCTNNIVTATVNTQNGASGNGDVSFNNLGLFKQEKIKEYIKSTYDMDIDLYLKAKLFDELGKIAGIEIKW